MPDYTDSNETSDHPVENDARDDDDDDRNPPPPPAAERTEAPQQLPGPQQQNPGAAGERGEEESDSDDDDGIDQLEDEELEALVRDLRNRESMERLEAAIADLARGSFENDIDFLAQYNLLLGGGLPPAMAALAALFESVQDRVQLGMAPEDIATIPGRTYAVPRCSVCGDVFREDDEVRQLPACRHEFHSSCLLTALGETGSADCPQCGQEILFN